MENFSSLEAKHTPSISYYDSVIRLGLHKIRTVHEVLTRTLEGLVNFAAFSLKQTYHKSI